MLTVAVIGLGSLGIFYIGYYFGSQMGRTESVRHHLAKVREHNQNISG